MRSRLSIQRPNYRCDSHPAFAAAIDIIVEAGRERIVKTTPPEAGAGEPELTRGQQVALLTMRKSDLSIAALDELKKQPTFGVHGADFHACRDKGLATNKGSYHVLNSQGRWRADKIAREVVNKAGLHIITYFDGDEYLPPKAVCSCGTFSARSTLRNALAISSVRNQAHAHLEFVKRKMAEGKS